MAILAGNRYLRLKVMLRGPKLWVNLILNVIGVRLRSTGTHFDYNRYIIRIFIFWVFYRSLWSHAKVSDPLYTGVPKIFFRKLLFEFVVSNPFHVLEVRKKIKSKFFNLSPLPTPSLPWLSLSKDNYTYNTKLPRVQGFWGTTQGPLKNTSIAHSKNLVS